MDAVRSPIEFRRSGVNRTIANDMYDQYTLLARNAVLFIAITAVRRQVSSYPSGAQHNVSFPDSSLLACP